MVKVASRNPMNCQAESFQPCIEFGLQHVDGIDSKYDAVGDDDGGGDDEDEDEDEDGEDDGW